MFLNKMQVIGRLTHTPIIRTTSTGVKVADLNLANNEKRKDSNGNLIERQYFYNVVAWRALADIAEKYAIKGQELYVEGKLVVEQYEGRDGTKKTKAYIIADTIQLGAKPLNADRPTAAEKTAAKNAEAINNDNFEGEEEEIRVENIPF